MCGRWVRSGPADPASAASRPKQQAEEPLVKDLLESYMAKATTRSVRDDALGPAVSRLAMEADSLLRTGRHGWVKRRAADLVDSGNWPAYAMEVHLTYSFESAGMETRNGVACLQGSSTDVDIVWQHHNGVEVRIECVALGEPAKFWTHTAEVGSGVEIRTACHHGEGESDLLRVVQDKIRLKTIDKKGAPIKFPEPEPSGVNLIIADVSNAAGWKPDWGDLQEIAAGRKSGLPFCKHDLIGLFERRNQLGAELDGDFRRSEYVRDRIHAIIYLIDESSFRHPLNPTYCGHGVVNPHLPMSPVQEEAADAIFVPLNALVTQGWLKEPRWRSR